MEHFVLIAIWYALIYPGLREIVQQVDWQPITGERYYEEKRRIFFYLSPFLLLILQWIVGLDWFVPQKGNEGVEFLIIFSQIIGIGIFVMLAYQTAVMRGWWKWFQIGAVVIVFLLSAYVTTQANPMHIFAHRLDDIYWIGYIYFGGMTAIGLFFVMYGYYRYFVEEKEVSLPKAQTYSAAIIGGMLLASFAYKTFDSSGQQIIVILLFVLSWQGASFLLSSLSKGWRRIFAFQLSAVLVYLLTELYVLYNLASWWNM